MYKRSMTTQELQAWVERADDPQEMQERADVANAGHPQMVTVMDDGEITAWMMTHRDALVQWYTGLVGCR